MSFTRQSQFGFRTRTKPSSSINTRFSPTAGYTERPDFLAGASSVLSGKNMWVVDGQLQPRDTLQHYSKNTHLGAEPVGQMVYDDISGTKLQMLFSDRTVAYYANQSLETLNFDSGVSDLPLTGNENDNIFGTSVYLPRLDVNLAVFTNGVEPLMVWNGLSGSTSYSVLTGSPICADVALFDNRLIAWNIQQLSSNSRFVQRIQWPVAGNPEDWTGIGSGFEDLVDMRGRGTRVFTLENEIIIASDREIWRGRKIGLPFIFSWEPLEKELGMPFQRAALNTQEGIFWLNDDFQIYHLSGGRITPIGDGIRDTLRTTLKNFNKAFFSYNPVRRQVSLHYSTVAGSLPDRAFTFAIEEKVWMPQVFPDALAAASVGVISSSATTWGGTTGTLGSHVLTFNDILGSSGADELLLFSSVGSAFQMSTSDSSEYNASVFTASAAFGGLFPEDNENQKYIDEIYLDVRADSASTLSVGISTNLGNSYGTTISFQPSVQSNTSQVRVNFGVSGANPSLKIEGNAGAWRVGAISVKGKLIGKVL